MIVRIVLAVIGAGVACIAYGALIERRAYRLVRRELPILPSDGPATLTILHLSDLHFLSRDARKQRFLASLPEADVTVVTGDFLAEPEAVETAVAAVRPTRGRLASWFVLGSNDYFAPRPMNYARYFRRHRRHRTARRGRSADLVAQLERDGWTDLTNTKRETELDGLRIELLGLDDAHLRWHDLRVAPRTTDRFGVAVMHSPDSAPETASLGYDLLIAGHTHGGQVRLPLVGALVVEGDCLAAALVDGARPVREEPEREAREVDGIVRALLDVPDPAALAVAGRRRRVEVTRTAVIAVAPDEDGSA